MEIEKVVRIVALTLVVAAFALRVATRLLFPDAAPSHDGILAIVLLIVLLLCAGVIWRGTPRTEKRGSGR